MVKDKSGQGRGRGGSYERRILLKVKSQYEEGFRPEEVQKQLGITGQQAADYVGRRLIKGGYIAEIIEITTESKKRSELGRQFEGAQKLVTATFGEAPVEYEYYIYTNNKQLKSDFDRDNRVPVFGKKKRVRVILEV
ncbi:MAG TPA: hypothetical protein VFS10_09830 [Pyrinomonadaceae bacterium]|nr:hypothetical protein [Pyrinomonadaceae bacterium]